MKEKIEFLEEAQLEFLKEGNYIEEGETIEDRFDQIVGRIKDYEKEYQEEGLSDTIDYMIRKNILSLSTPALSNFGRPRKEGSNTTPLPVSCNIVTYPDSIAGIYFAHGETAMLSKLGAGVGQIYINIVDRGTKLAEGFFSNSKLDYIEDGVGTAQKVSQGSKRRGYAVPFISILDPDFDDLMKRVDKRNPNKDDVLITNTCGIILPSGFRQSLSSDKEYQRRWMKVIQARKKTGKIYILDVDNCNINQSPVYEKLGLEVNATNICCVTGDQMVATKKGFKTVKELADSNTPLELFDNESVNPSTSMLYRGFWDTYKISLKNGMTHTITSNHKLITRDIKSKQSLKSIDEGLKVGDKILIQSNKGIFGDKHYPELAFLLGLFLGDGSHTSYNSTRISVWENDFDLIPEIEKTCEDFYNKEGVLLHHSNKLPKFIESSTGDSEVKKMNLTTSIFNNNGFPFKKGDIPSWILEADEETHWQLIRGLLYADGTVGDYNKGKSFGKPINLSLASIDYNMLQKIQIITSNLGLKVKIYNFRDAGSAMLPKNDGTGKLSEYKTKDIYRLVLSNKTDLLELEKNTGFLSRKGVFIEDKLYRDNSHKSSEIISIDFAGKQDVYCPTVDSDRHLWICNGVITSNTEFIQPTFEDMTSACVLSSLNLVHWDEIKANPQYVRAAFIFLDILNEEYIRLTEGVPFLEKANRAAKQKRDIGLGTLGLHELFQMKGMVFGDIYSRRLNKEIYSFIREIGESTTKELAHKLGSAPLASKAGLIRRNCSLMMIAPNKSTSFISGCTSLGIEPFMSNVFMKAIAKIQHVFKNKHLIKLLESKGKNTPQVWESVMKNLGSVQHLDFLDEYEKGIYKTFAEISPKDIIDLASDRQKFIDMGQSLNLVIRPNYSLKDLHEMHMYAFDKGVKTLYYAYPQAHAALEKDGEAWDTCESCAD